MCGEGSMFSYTRANRAREVPATMIGLDKPRAWYAMTLQFGEAGRDPGGQPHGSPFTMNSWYVPPASKGGAGKADDPHVILPPVDVRIGREDILLRADMPGIPKENIDIRIFPRYIEIIGTPPEDEDPGDEAILAVEGSHSKYRNTRGTHERAVPEGVRAKLVDGTLELRLPKEMVLCRRRISRIPVR